PLSFRSLNRNGPNGSELSSTKRYAYVGLVQRRGTPSNPTSPPTTVLGVKSSLELAEEFANSVMVCRKGVRRTRWESALKTLEADPLFAERNVSALADDNSTQI